MEVRLISPQYVIPFVKTNKNDRNDAEAIAEAAGRPTMRFVTVKSVEQQDMQAVHRVRELLVAQRTALINQARGLLAERGVTIAQSPAAFKRAVPQILGQCEGEVTSICQAMLMELVQQIQVLEERNKHAESWIKSFMKRSALCKKISAIAGVGPITATAMDQQSAQVGVTPLADALEARLSSGRCRESSRARRPRWQPSGDRPVRYMHRSGWINLRVSMLIMVTGIDYMLRDVYIDYMSDQILFESLVDEIRRRILALLLKKEELCVCELHQVLDQPQPKVSRHLGVLRDAGVVTVRRVGTWMFYRLSPELPLWAYRVIEQMAAGAAGNPIFCRDSERLEALPGRYVQRARDVIVA